MSALIKSAQDREGGLRLTVATEALGMDDVQLGDSIAVNGVCLTVVKIAGKDFTVDVSRETLNCTVGLEQQGGTRQSGKGVAPVRPPGRASGQRPCRRRGRGARVQRHRRELATGGARPAASWPSTSR